MTRDTENDHYNASEVLFRNLQAGRGEKICLICGPRKVSYRDLARQAARVGNGLRALGLRGGDRALMILPDIPEFAAFFFGALRAGIIPVPVNTFLPPHEYEFFLRDSGAQAAVISGDFRDAIDTARPRVPSLEHVIVVGEEVSSDCVDWDQWIGAASSELEPAPTSRSDPAFWLYSSGSTGLPKGVIHTHGAIPCTIDNYAYGVLGMTENDHVFSVSKAFHAYGLGNSLTFPLGVGASSVLYPGRPTPELIFRELEKHQPTVFFTVPTFYAAMLAAAKDSAWTPARLRLCVSAAEALPPDIFRRWRDRYGVEILDGIGSTEMLHIFISNRPGNCREGSSGVPVPGYDCRVWAEDSRTARANESGSLMVRGASASPGYWNRPRATARGRCDDWTVTGDRYHCDEDGFFFYEGRSDDMFKVGGQWVSPVEVENTLIQHEAVLECAVVAYQDEEELTRSKAFVKLNDGYQGSAELVGELQTFVKSSIAPYKYPRAIQFVESLPKTVTGKIQRFRLRD